MFPFFMLSFVFLSFTITRPIHLQWGKKKQDPDKKKQPGITC